MPMPHMEVWTTAAWPIEKPDVIGNIMMAAKPIRTTNIEVIALVRRLLVSAVR